MDNAKSIFESTTFWGNLLAVIVGVLPLLGIDLTDFQPESWVDQLILIIGGALNIANRFRTKQPVKLP